MEKLRPVVARAAERVARSRPMRSLRALMEPSPGPAGGQQGQGLAEYSLILGLIAIAAIVSLIFLGTSITDLFDDIINQGFDYVSTLLGTP